MLVYIASSLERTLKGQYDSVLDSRHLMAAVSLFTDRWRQTSHTAAVSGIITLLPQGQKRFYRFSLRLRKP